MINNLLEIILEKVLEGETIVSEIESLLLRCYQKSKENKHNILVIDENIWERDLEEFYELLKDYKIADFVLINNPSTADAVYYLIERGCTIYGTFKYSSITGQEYKGLNIAL